MKRGPVKKKIDKLSNELPELGKLVNHPVNNLAKKSKARSFPKLTKSKAISQALLSKQKSIAQVF